MQFHDWILTSHEEVDTFMLSILHLPSLTENGQRSPRDSSLLSGVGALGAEAFMAGHCLWAHDTQHLHKPFWLGFRCAEFTWPGLSASS